MIAILFRAPIAAQIKEIIEISFGNTRARFNRPQEERPPLSSSPLGIPADQGAVRLARVEVPAQVEAPAPAPAAQLLADQVLSSTNDPLYIQRGDKVREALAEAGVLDIPDLAVRVLTRLTGTWIMIAAFENLYGFLWGGQVTLLRDTAGAPMPLARAAAFSKSGESGTRLRHQTASIVG
jgi:hypothetical protein